jgi:hypothetical protein
VESRASRAKKTPNRIGLKETEELAELKQLRVKSRVGRELRQIQTKVTQEGSLSKK